MKCYYKAKVMMGWNVKERGNNIIVNYCNNHKKVNICGILIGRKAKKLLENSWESKNKGIS